MSLLHTTRRLAAATPASRDRTLDLLRGGSLAVVVVGHWVLAVAWVGPDGLGVGNALALAPWTQPLTWVLQVMPLFFLVGGHVNAVGWRSASVRGAAGPAWVRRRAARLLIPAVPLLTLWAGLGPALPALGVDHGLARLGTQAALVPLWFLAVYLVVAASTPLAVALHDRHGLAVPVGLGVTAALVDVAHLAGVPVVGGLNFLLVWGCAHQLGIAWAGGRLAGRGVGAGLLAGGLVAMVGLVSLGGYPLSLVGVDGAARSNTAPPSLLLVALTCAQTGAVLALRERLDRLVARPGVWHAVVGLNLLAMPLYLWHLTVSVVVIGALGAAGSGALLAPGGPLSGWWWATRPLWVAGLVLLVLPVVLLAAQHERQCRVPGGGLGPAGVAAAVTIASGGITIVVIAGLAAPWPGLAGVIAAVAAARVLVGTRLLARTLRRAHTASMDGRGDGG